MRLGFHQPIIDEQGVPLEAKGVMAWAKKIEDAGFQSVWLGDQPGQWNDRMSSLLVAGAATDHLEVGTAIQQISFRNPVEQAQKYLTIQAMLRGRFCVGVGSGSNQRSFDVMGQSDEFPNRFKLLDANLKTIQALMRGEQVGAANLNPPEVTRPGPPIVIGAWASGIWVRRAAKSYDGWMTSGGRSNYRTLKEGIERYRGFGGKRAMVATMAIDFTAPITPLDDEAPELRGDLQQLGRSYGAENGFSLLGPPEVAKERLARLAGLGYDDALVYLRTPGRGLYSAPDEDSMKLLRSLVPIDSSAPVYPGR